MKNIDYAKLFSDYGTLLVLLLLCIGFSAVTLEEQSPTSANAAQHLAKRISDELSSGSNVIVLTRQGGDGESFAAALKESLTKAELNVVQTVVGQPADARKALVKYGATGNKLAGITADKHMANFCNANLAKLAETHPSLAKARVYQPQSYLWPNFLKKENLLNIMKQISVVAIIAIGMTMIIITAGIDLSVGSLIAFSGVITALAIRGLGGDDPTMGHLWLGSLAGILVCGLVGLFTGGLVTLFGIPAFIATLGIMFSARGLAFIFADSEPIAIGNEAFGWLGRGRDFLGLPNSVILMLILFAIAHVLMTRTSIGRYIYAVGGNPEAARLSGVPVKWVLVFVYTLTGLLAGLGGVMEASLHVTGDPKAGNLVELQVIAAVVVGGTSLAGGQGKILGTLIGAFIIGVIRNGMNLTGVEAHMQSVVYGVVILIAVLIDRLKSQGFGLWKR
ncbi:MAG: ABC transporter permease [Verrucomicrobiota bacterium]|nr:ABC transporter permease [Verrucomicrobiota bacterium]